MGSLCIGNLDVLIHIMLNFILGHKGTIFCIDGAPDFLYAILTLTMQTKNDRLIQNNLIKHTLDLVSPKSDVSDTLLEKLNEIESFEDRIHYAIKVNPVQTQYSNNFISSMAMCSYDRLKMVLNHTENDIKKIKAPIILLRPKENPPNMIIEDTYGLDKLTEGPVTVHHLEGNHVSIIENKDCANIINRILAEQDGRGKISQNVITSMVEKQRIVKV